MAEDPGSILGGIDAEALGSTALEAALAAGIGVTVTFVDGDAPRFAYVSPVAADLLGWPVDVLLTRGPLDIIAPSARDDVDARWKQRQGGASVDTAYPIRVLRQDGREVQVDVVAGRGVARGRPVVVAFLFDAGARHEGDRQRMRNDARFRELVQTAPELIGIIRGGHFVWANDAYVRALGFATAVELGSAPIADLVEPEAASVQVARESAVLQGGTRIEPHTYRVRRRDGTWLLLEASSVPFEYEGKPSVLTMARDVTEKKKLERQLIQADRLAALGTMAAGVAHEINNPLAYVMLNLEWIERKLPSVLHDPSSLPALLVMLEEARQGAERVSVIVRELRSFSRADAETRRPVDLATVVQSAIKIVGNEVRHRATIVTSFEPTRLVMGNEARLEQVVVNLLLNAAQAMPEGSTENNEVRVTVREESDRSALLEVHDNGTGIPAEVLPRIFDPFFSTKPVGVGTGLGLSICHGIVTAAGGRIRAYSEPRDGTTFRVTLPTTEATTLESSPPVSEPPPSRETVQRARILVVDDEPHIGNTLKELLAPVHEVVSVTSAREALTALEQSRFDVAFCDLMMPGTSGIELFDAIRTRWPGVERRIVFMTGGAFTARAAEFLASVPNRRLEKPFSLGIVERLVGDLMASHRESAAGS